MATDFFQRQDDARKRTARLVFLFGLAVLTLIVAIYLLCAFVFFFLPQRGPHEPRPSLWNPVLLACVAAGVSLVVGGGALLKTAELASGGKAVALMMHGREIAPDTQERAERRLLNIVEEMAIASGTPVPPVFVLPEEGINAFAAGHEPGDAVVAVSAGCLTYLTRDEIQGVIGHEFSHILNGDMRLNMRLIGVIFGITGLSQLGWVLLQSASFPTVRSRDSKDDNRGALMILGLGLYVLGMAGAFFGWLIQAAVSRQREHLADASAVQFTRNPDGIAGALKKIGGLEQGSRINDAHAGEIGHLFLADAFFGRRLSDLLATHPPLVERIRLLDPQFDGTFPAVKALTADAEPTKQPTARRPPIQMPGMPQLPFPAVVALAEPQATSAGTVQAQHVAYAGDLRVEFPPVLLDAARSPFSARALIYALLLDPKTEVRQGQLAHLQQHAPPKDFAATERLAEIVRQLRNEARLPLADLAMPALRQMSPEQHRQFRAEVEALIHADQQVSLFEYCLHCVLSRHLDAAFEKTRPTIRYTSAGELAPEAVVVLSLLAWEGHADANAARAGFALGWKKAFRSALPDMLPRERCMLRAFDEALRALDAAAPPIKLQMLAGCAACILADAKATVREGELLRAVSAALGCPLPPLTVAA